MKILILDGYNLLYRARYSGPRNQPGPYMIIYRFFRSLRPIIERFSPHKIYFVLEGIPKQRLEWDSEYKGTRVREHDESFSLQRKKIIEMLGGIFPITVIRHPDYECDDVIGHLVNTIHQEDNCTVVSTDTDFLQLYNTARNVSIYNPIKKKTQPSPEYDYVRWKALKGDGADNIIGFKGVGNVRARKLVENPDELTKFLNTAEKRKKFEHNVKMIKFHDTLNEKGLEYSDSLADWNAVKSEFTKMEFHSIINSKAWEKYMYTFSCVE